MNAFDMIARSAIGQGGQREPDDLIRRVLTLRADDRILPYDPMAPAAADAERMAPGRRGPSGERAGSPDASLPHPTRVDDPRDQPAANGGVDMWPVWLAGVVLLATWALVALAFYVWGW